MESGLLSIGEFSKVVGITVKALRFYHDREILVPAYVEVGSGYRYYGKANLETAQIIVMLRDLGFSVEDIRSFLKEQSNDESALDYLIKRRKDVQAKLSKQRSILLKLDRMIQGEQDRLRQSDRYPTQIETRELDPMLVAGIRMKGHYADIGNGFRKLSQSAWRHICGKAMCLLYDEEYREDDADFEAVFPIKKPIQGKEFSVRELQGGTAICIRHVGPYQTIGRSYGELFEYARQSNHTMLTPTREVFLKGPGLLLKGNPNHYVTEIQVLVGVS